MVRMEEDWAQIQELFRESLRRVGDERSKFLDAACVDAPQLREKLENLLLAHEDADEFLTPPEEDSEERAVPSMPREIGHWK